MHWADDNNIEGLNAPTAWQQEIMVEKVLLTLKKIKITHSVKHWTNVLEITGSNLGPTWRQEKMLENQTQNDSIYLDFR